MRDNRLLERSLLELIIIIRVDLILYSLTNLRDIAMKAMYFKIRPTAMTVMEP